MHRPADFNTFIQLLNSTDYFQLYNGLKQIFDTLTWDQEQVTEFQSIFTDQVIDGFCTLGNGVSIWKLFASENRSSNTCFNM